MDKSLSTKKGPKVKITCLSNVYTRMMHFEEAGIVELGHTHIYDHAMLIAKGKISVKLYNPETKEFLPPKEYTAPDMVYIRKELVHQIESLEETLAFCIHALRDEDETIFAPDMIPVPSSFYDSARHLYEETGKKVLSVIDSNDEFTNKRHIRVDNIFEK